jgi:integrase
VKINPQEATMFDRQTSDVYLPAEDAGRKRGQKKGYLYQRGPSWFLQYIRIDGAEKTVRIGAATGLGKLSRRQAERIAWDDYLEVVYNHSNRPSSRQTIEQFINESFIPGLVWTLKPSGKAHYTNMLENHVLPALGKVKLCDLGPHDVQELVRWKLDNEHKSVQTAVHIKNTISAIFRYAKTMQAYSGDLPTEGVRLPPVNAAERKALTWPQVQALAEQLPEQTGILITVLTLTGLRIGEAVGLRWKRVNLNEEPRLQDGEILPGYTLAVRENHVLGAYCTLKPGRNTRRNIPITGECWVALSRLKAGGPDEPVFVNRVGKPIDWRNIAERHLKPAAKALGVPWVSFHTFRHTNSTLADQAGLSVAERQRILGHSSSGMTMRYSHADIEQVRGRMEKIGKRTVN